jgi:hypothetical protein
MGNLLENGVDPLLKKPARKKCVLCHLYFEKLPFHRQSCFLPGVRTTASFPCSDYGLSLFALFKRILCTTFGKSLIICYPLWRRNAGSHLYPPSRIQRKVYSLFANSTKTTVII